MSYPGRADSYEHEYDGLIEAVRIRHQGESMERLQAFADVCFNGLDVIRDAILRVQNGPDASIVATTFHRLLLIELGVADDMQEFVFAQWIHHMVFLTTFGFLTKDSENGIYIAPDLPATCGFCGKDDAPKKCSRCRIVRYCDKTCQRAHWEEHKKICIIWRCFVVYIYICIYMYMSVYLLVYVCIHVYIILMTS